MIVCRVLRAIEAVASKGLVSRRVARYIAGNSLIAFSEFNQIVADLPAPVPEESLAAQFPEVCEFWDSERNAPLTPGMFTPKSNQEVYWRCSKGHSRKGRISDRTSLRKFGHCPRCLGRTLSPETALPTAYPKVAEEWHSTKNGKLAPSDVPFGSARSVWWECSKCGHEWRREVKARVAGVGCAKCAAARRGPVGARTRLARGKALSERFPDLALDWHPTKNKGITPSDVAPFTEREVWWLCIKCGQEWQERVMSRKRCPKCGRRPVRD